MKNIFLTILFQFFFLLAIQAQEALFEGIIESVLQNTTGIEYQIKWYIKEGKIAYELSFETPDRGKFNMRLVPQIEKKTILMVTGDTKIEVPSSEISNAQSFDLSDLKLGHALGQLRVLVLLESVEERGKGPAHLLQISDGLLDLGRLVRPD